MYRKGILTNKKVVRALTIGLAAVLATPSMTAYAEVLSDDDKIVTSDDKTEKEVVEVKSDNQQAINDAKTKAETAVGLEDDVYKNAVKEIKPGDGVSDVALADIALNERDETPKFDVEFEGRRPVVKVTEPNDSAAEFDEAAAKDAKEASDELAKGKTKVEGDLKTASEKNELAEEAISDANTAANQAAADLIKTDDALKAANAATTSEAASAQAAIAKEASEDAAAQATTADEKAKEALRLYNEANTAYEQAVKDANAANKAADAKVEAGAEDAAEAVKYAKEAQRVADGLQKEMETYRDQAKNYMEYYTGELANAEERLSELREIRDAKKEAFEDAAGDLSEAGKQWFIIYNKVSEAQKTLDAAPSETTISQLNQQVTNLKQQMQDAQTALGELERIRDGKKTVFEGTEDPEQAARNLIDAINADYELTGKEKVANVQISEESEDALVKKNSNLSEISDEELELARNAVALITEAYEKAVAKEAEASGKVTKLTGDIATLKRNFGKDIGDIEESIIENKEDKADQVLKLIGRIGGGTAVATPGNWGEGYENGLYKVTGQDGTEKFYKYEVSEDGIISVFECQEDVDKIIDRIIDRMAMDDSTPLTEAELAEIRKGLTDGTYYIETKNETITTDPTYAWLQLTVTNTEFKRGDLARFDNERNEGTVTINFKKGITQTYKVKYIYYSSQYTGWCIEDTDGKLYSFEAFRNRHTSDLNGSAKQFAETYIPEIYFKTATFVGEWLKPDEYENYKDCTSCQITDTVIAQEGSSTTKTTYIIHNGKVEEKFTSLEDAQKALAQYEDDEVWHSEIVTTYDGQKTESKYKATTRDREYSVYKGHKGYKKELTETQSPESALTVFVKMLKDGNYQVEYCDNLDNLTLNDVDFTFDCSGDGHGIGYYSVSQDTLRYYNGNWQYRFGEGPDDFKNIQEMPGYKSNSYQVKIRNYIYLDESELPTNSSVYIWHVSSEASEVVTETGTPQYTIIHQYYKADDKYGYSTVGDSTNVDNLKALNTALSAAQNLQSRANNIKTLKETYEAKLSAYKTAQDELNTAQTNLTNKQNEINNKNYPKLIEDAEKAYTEAYNKRKNAKDALDIAKRELVTATTTYGTALGEFNKAAAQYANAQLNVDFQKGVKGRLQSELKTWTDSYNKWVKKSEMAKNLALDAKKAYEAAVEAQEQFDSIPKSNLGAAALEQMRLTLEATKKAYEEARAAADQAALDAEEAKKEYQQILDRVNALIAAENVPGTEGGVDETATEEGGTPGAGTLLTIPGAEGDTLTAGGAGVPGAPGAPAAGAGVVVNAAEGEGAPATTTFGPTQAAKAAGLDDNKTNQATKEFTTPKTPLAAEIPDAEHIAWYWLLIIAALGASGYTAYKKFGKKEEKVTK